LDHENEVMQILKSSIEESKCDIDELTNIVNRITSETMEEGIKKHLECLGIIDILEGDWGFE
jgi:hypothetical protein